MKNHLHLSIVLLALWTTLSPADLPVGAGKAAAYLSPDLVVPAIVWPTNSDAMLADAVQGAAVIARGRVVEMNSRWSDDRSQVQSRSRLEIHYLLRGPANKTILVDTVGGYFGK